MSTAAIWTHQHIGCCMHVVDVPISSLRFSRDVVPTIGAVTSKCAYRIRKQIPEWKVNLHGLLIAHASAICAIVNPFLANSSTLEHNPSMSAQSLDVWFGCKDAPVNNSGARLWITTNHPITLRLSCWYEIQGMLLTQNWPISSTMYGATPLTYGPSK